MVVQGQKIYDGQMEQNNEDREIDIQASIHLSKAMVAAVRGGT